MSTLHTNSAAETITRLLDMGLEPFNVASALNLVLAQRLVRRICSSCRVRVEWSDDEFRAAKLTPEMTFRDLRYTDEAIENMKRGAVKEALPIVSGFNLDTKVSEIPLFKGRGCDTCNGLGLKGRQGLYEVMAMTPKVRKIIIQQLGAVEIRDAAISDGMLTLRMDGLLKVMKGITTLEQVIRETSA
jgi:type IV pilus assembly protein PilB